MNINTSINKNKINNKNIKKDVSNSDKKCQKEENTEVNTNEPNY